ncbi:MAG TPA: hypothetical protein VFC50_03990 [Candidatus Dormibacteraeota bacterium]|nr:hypothetical protein [Candidatus Dormibacteraeota bacterium]
MITYDDKDIERLIDQAAERAVGFYYEKTKHDIGLVLEATDFIKDKLEDMVTRDGFNELGSEVKTIRHVVTATNRDVRRHDKRIAKLEQSVFHD